VDYAGAAVKIAKELVEGNALPNAHILRSSSEELEFKTGSFDLVFLNDVVEHLYPEPLEKTMGEIQRVLKPNGQLVIHTMPNAFLSKPLYNLIRVIGLSRGPINPHIHVNEQTSISLRALLKKSGFDSLDFSFELNGDWFRAATAYGRVKFFAEPIVKLLEAKPFQFLINNSPLKIFLSTDIFVAARKKAN
jgi:predicted SAM-dependent methyltransferase